MIHDIEGRGAVAAESRRVLAVVAGKKERACEVAACFASQGDRVEALWYPNVGKLLEAAESAPRLEAVILFAAADEATGDAEEAAVRGAIRGMPVYRL